MSDSTVVQVRPGELDLDSTLLSGQAYRWYRSGNDWIGVVGDAVWRLRLEGVSLYGERYAVAPSGSRPDFGDELQSFFRLDFELGAYIAEYSESHPVLASAIQQFRGMRIVRQPVADALIGFACSPANHVGRIARSLDLLALHFGKPIVEIDGRRFSALPDWERLAASDPLEIRRLANLGYRGKTLQKLGEAVAAKPAGWLEGLAEVPYREAQAELAALPGIGPKIADCVCLYGLGHDEAIPVDTHIWAIARDLFGDEITTASLTSRTYGTISDMYRTMFPLRPGWAQHYLFHQRRSAGKMYESAALAQGMTGA